MTIILQASLSTFTIHWSMNKFLYDSKVPLVLQLVWTQTYSCWALITMASLRVSSCEIIRNPEMFPRRSSSHFLCLKKKDSQVKLSSCCCLSVCLSVSVCPSVCKSLIFCLSVSHSVCPSVTLYVCQSVCLSFTLSVTVFISLCLPLSQCRCKSVCHSVTVSCVCPSPRVQYIFFASADQVWPKWGSIQPSSSSIWMVTSIELNLIWFLKKFWRICIAFDN